MGVHARRPENSLGNGFLVINLFYSLERGSNGFITEKTILFQGSRGGPTFSGVGVGGATFSRGGGWGGGSNAYFYRNPNPYHL